MYTLVIFVNEKKWLSNPLNSTLLSPFEEVFKIYDNKLVRSAIDTEEHDYASLCSETYTQTILNTPLYSHTIANGPDSKSNPLHSNTLLKRLTKITQSHTQLSHTPKQSYNQHTSTHTSQKPTQASQLSTHPHTSHLPIGTQSSHMLTQIDPSNTQSSHTLHTHIPTSSSIKKDLQTQNSSETARKLHTKIQVSHTHSTSLQTPKTVSKIGQIPYSTQRDNEALSEKNKQEYKEQDLKEVSTSNVENRIRFKDEKDVYLQRTCLCGVYLNVLYTGSPPPILDEASLIPPLPLQRSHLVFVFCIPSCLGLQNLIEIFKNHINDIHTIKQIEHAHTHLQNKPQHLNTHSLLIIFNTQHAADYFYQQWHTQTWPIHTQNNKQITKQWPFEAEYVKTTCYLGFMGNIKYILTSSEVHHNYNLNQPPFESLTGYAIPHCAICLEKLDCTATGLHTHVHGWTISPPFLSSLSPCKVCNTISSYRQAADLISNHKYKRKGVPPHRIISRGNIYGFDSEPEEGNMGFSETNEKYTEGSNLYEQFAPLTPTHRSVSSPNDMLSFSRLPSCVEQKKSRRGKPVNSKNIIEECLLSENVSEKLMLITQEGPQESDRCIYDKEKTREKIYGSPEIMNLEDMYSSNTSLSKDEDRSKYKHLEEKAEERCTYTPKKNFNNSSEISPLKGYSLSYSKNIHNMRVGTFSEHYQPSINMCTDCDEVKDLWICLLCSHIGCGRYTSGHAKEHGQVWNHRFCLNLQTGRIWDYLSDVFVHKHLNLSFKTTSSSASIELPIPNPSALFIVTPTSVDDITTYHHLSAVEDTQKNLKTFYSNNQFNSFGTDYIQNEDNICNEPSSNSLISSYISNQTPHKGHKKSLNQDHKYYSYHSDTHNTNHKALQNTSIHPTHYNKSPYQKHTLPPSEPIYHYHTSLGSLGNSPPLYPSPHLSPSLSKKADQVKESSHLYTSLPSQEALRTALISHSNSLKSSPNQKPLYLQSNNPLTPPSSYSLPISMAVENSSHTALRYKNLKSLMNSSPMQVADKMVTHLWQDINHDGPSSLVLDSLSSSIAEKNLPQDTIIQETFSMSNEEKNIAGSIKGSLKEGVLLNHPHSYDWEKERNEEDKKEFVIPTLDNVYAYENTEEIHRALDDVFITQLEYQRHLYEKSLLELERLHIYDLELRTARKESLIDMGNQLKAHIYQQTLIRKETDKQVWEAHQRIKQINKDIEFLELLIPFDKCLETNPQAANLKQTSTQPFTTLPTNNQPPQTNRPTSSTLNNKQASSYESQIKSFEQKSSMLDTTTLKLEQELEGLLKRLSDQ